jgi:hypothetical protein
MSWLLVILLTTGGVEHRIINNHAYFSWVYCAEEAAKFNNEHRLIVEGSSARAVCMTSESLNDA